jgi:hypothetical protein
MPGPGTEKPPRFRPRPKVERWLLYAVVFAVLFTLFRFLLILHVLKPVPVVDGLK